MRTFIWICVMGIVLWSVGAMAQTDGATLRAFVRLDSTFETTLKAAPNDALVIADELLAKAKQLNRDTLLLHALLQRASALGMLGIFDAALKDLLTAFRRAEAGGHVHHQIQVARLIAQAFQSLSDYKKSTQYLLKARALCLASGNADTLGITMELAFNQAVTGEVEKGLALLEACLDAAIALGDEEIIVLALDNLGNIHFENGDHAIALTYILREADYPKILDNNFNRTVYYEHLAEVYVKLEDWKNAERMLDSACHYARLIASNDWLFECYKLRTEVEAAKGNHAAALANHRLYMQLKDSVYQQTYANTFAAMTTLHDVENKENAIKNLKMERTVQEERLRKVALQRNGLIAMALLAGVIAYLLFRTVQARRESRLKEQFSGELIQEQENERQRISRELHDNIGQYLLFIRNKLSHQRSDDRNATLLETVDSALTEVRAISKELYPNQLERYGLEASIQLLFDNLRQGSELFVSCDLTDVEARLIKEQQLGVFRIVQECLSNTIKYAEATAFRVEGHVVNHSARFIVQDNGKGARKTDIDARKHRSFGLLNIEERIRLLKGSHHYHTLPDKGFKLTFSIPI